MQLLDNQEIGWERYTGDPVQADRSFNWPIDYSGAILDIRDDGHVEVLYRWAPNSYCHFHRHLAPTTSTVLSGELHVTDFDDDGREIGTRVRTVGDYSHTAEPDIHMERGGPDGAIVLFNIYAPDGDLTHSLTRDLKILHTSTAAEW